ncbi:4-aminobutyrate--2-oxoglutarate transaminase [Saccharopolyspora terrae]|uniref:(S)-3-amino-2-methylpropionate transaminase n=2 Tax=Saccharopolyspora terrae TaxID=2530384 RepID=A0A4R4VMD4_9PSEU|nr:4-aminobutyrate--2-oxoglutarate transaminase [Saccharopolyspora terrae]TDD03345.1 4-aminobutyrate--2-oxoglutarate transaminase [Saccharopolyspora terrae]
MTKNGENMTQRRLLKTAIPGPKSLALAARRQAAVGRGVASALPIYAASASGAVVTDVDGNQLIDLAAGIGVTTVGVSAPRVVDAVRDQAAAATHTCFMVSPYEPYIEICERLNRLTPGDHPKTTVLFNSGSEAVENAVKVARVATGRQAVVVLDNAYHGRTNLTLAMTARSAPFKQGFGPYAPEIYRVPASNPLRDGLDGPAAAARTVEAITTLVGAGQVAAIVAEPIAGEGGFIVPAAGFLAELATFARDNGILLIADEVQSGIGRTGQWFAIEHEDVVPDIVAIAKGVAGGLPLSAITGRKDVMDKVGPGGLGGTYGGNPVACAAAIAALETVEAEGLLERARWIETVVRECLEPLVAAYPSVAEVRGRGAMVAVELVDEDGAPATDLCARVIARCHAEGVIVMNSGPHRNVVRLLPALVIEEDLLRDGLEVLAKAIVAEATATR